MRNSLQLGVNEIPRWSDAILFGFQQAMISTPGFLVYPILVSEVVCAGSATLSLRVQLIAATFVACGLATLLQTKLGIRLPILQGPSIAFLPPLLVYKNQRSCGFGESDHVDSEEWRGRLNEIAGSLMAASCVFLLVGITGLAGVFAKLIGPVTITPLMLLLSISIMPTIEEKLSIHWISIVVGLMSIYLEAIVIRLPYSNRKIRLFGQFPYLLSITWVWLLCAFLTVTDIETKDSPIRTDRNLTITDPSWFNLPHPGMFGVPRFNSGLFVGYVASALAAVVENLGNYNLLARVTRQRPPPKETVSRGILVEGLGSLLSSSMGIGTAVASRRTMELAGLFLVFLGVFTKCAALLATIPEALVGGMLCMGVAMIAGVSISNLQLVDLSKSRNLSIIGLSLMIGLIVPRHVDKSPISFGINGQLDDIANMLLSIKMLVGGMVAVFLDNTVPGATPAERGIQKVEKDILEDFDEDAYAFRGSLGRFLQSCPPLPFLPKEVVDETTSRTFV